MGATRNCVYSANLTVCLHVLKKSCPCPDFGSINPCLALCNPIWLGSIPVFASVLGVQFYIVSECVAMFMGDVIRREVCRVGFDQGNPKPETDY
jgi:hypothetical protein